MEIRIEDLFVPCEKCNSTGEVIERHGSGGFGYSSIDARYCQECNGTGGKITTSGQAVLQFLRLLKSQGHL